MTLLQAIDGIDELMHNTYSQEQKVKWLSFLDAIVKEQVIDTHEHPPEVIFGGYTPDTPMDTVLEALKEAMKFAYGDKYYVPEDALEQDSRIVGDDPFGDAAKKTVEEEPAKKAEEVSASVDRGVEHEKYTPVPEGQKPTPKKKVKKVQKKEPEKKEPEKDPFAPGENIDPSDIASVRAMLSGGN